MIDKAHDLPVVRQAELLELSRYSVYYLPQPASDKDLRLMRRIDELHLEYPFAGARMLRDLLKLQETTDCCNQYRLRSQLPSLELGHLMPCE